MHAGDGDCVPNTSRQLAHTSVFSPVPALNGFSSKGERPGLLAVPNSDVTLRQLQRSLVRSLLDWGGHLK